ncbi:MAG: hypothetical protein KTR29_11840 [Rhodothermaceae bacterium]|nr:hypothetical protein [Rhodothermaceae bacterium]
MEPHNRPNSPSSHSEFSLSDDSVAKAIEWSPLVKGGANFRTHKLKKVGYHIYVSSPTVGYHIFYGLFILFGIGVLVLAALRLDGSLLLLGMLLFMASIFVGVGVYLMLKAINPFTIDLDLGTFYIGRSYNPLDDNSDGSSGSVKDIHALQLIAEHIKSENSSYTSYELNLVLKDGRRVNVMDHGRQSKIYEEAQTLSELLGVPIWSSPQWTR